MTAPVSVIIPCYNCAASVVRTAASVLAQSLPVREMILVNDGSTDETLEQLRALAREHKGLIRVCENNGNQGVSVARNTGWQNATQEYLAFLDADDFWHPEKVRLQYEWMKSHPEAALSGHLTAYLQAGEAVRYPPVDGDFKVVPIGRRRILFSNPFVTPSVMLKRCLPQRFNPQRRYCEDFLLWSEICLAGHTLYRLQAPLTVLNKPPLVGGASGHTLSMRKGEIGNFKYLWQSGQIGFLRMAGHICYSGLKAVLLAIAGKRIYVALSHWVKRIIK
jgi:glycosyltransferase involved in cell wall biosynthesis